MPTRLPHTDTWHYLLHLRVIAACRLPVGFWARVHRSANLKAYHSDFISEKIRSSWISLDRAIIKSIHILAFGLARTSQLNATM